MNHPGAPLPVDPWAASVEAERPTTTIGPYELLGTLGQGGMGVVHRARHRGLGVVRALKLMLRGDAKALARFEREVANLARVRHPNVAGIHEAGTDAGRPWFAMELVEGEPLSKLAARGRLPLERALVLAIGITEGVAALHRAGVIHRDLKPQNVIVRADGRPMVIDLGLAVAPEQDTRLTRTGAMLGTLGYMAPEQLSRAREVTPRTDVYALGCIVFELATGASAVDSENGLHGVVADVLANDRPLPSSVDDSLSGLDDLVARATARDPARRFADADELGAALKRLLADPTSGEVKVPPRRRRAGWIAAGVVGLAAVGVGAARVSRPPADACADDHGGSAALPEDVLERGRRGLEELRARPAPERLTALDGWLLEFAAHPAADEAARLRAATLLETPRRRWSVAGVRRALFAGDGARAVTCAASGEVAVWDLTSGERARAWQELPRVRDAALGGDHLAALDERGRPWTFDLTTGTARELDRTATGEVVAVSRDGERIVVGSVWSGRQAPRAALIDRRSGRVTQSHTAPAQVTAVAFSPDGRQLVVGFGATSQFELGLERGVDVYDLVQQARRHRVSTRRIPLAATYLGDGRAAVGFDDIVALLDAKTGSWTGELEAHRDGVRGLAAGGGRLVSLAGELRVWDAAAARELAVVRGVRKPARVDVSPDGARALVACADGAVELWDLTGVAPAAGVR